MSANNASTDSTTNSEIPTWTYDATCMSPRPLVSYVQEVQSDKTMSWITGTVTATDQTILSPSDDHLVLTRLVVQVDSLVAGRKLPPGLIEVYVAGGTFQEKARAVTGQTGAVAWGADGRFFGAVFESESVPPNTYKLIALPVVDGDTILSPAVGCVQFSAGQGNGTTKSSVTVFRDGAPSGLSGIFPTESLSELMRQTISLR